jgi:hypothetical protein
MENKLKNAIIDNVGILAKNKLDRINKNIMDLFRDNKNEELRYYLETLLFDNRGNRSGFPNEVVSALIKIYAETKESKIDIWRDSVISKRG